MSISTQLEFSGNMWRTPCGNTSNSHLEVAQVAWLCLLRHHGGAHQAIQVEKIWHFVCSEKNKVCPKWNSERNYSKILCIYIYIMYICTYIVNWQKSLVCILIHFWTWPLSGCSSHECWSRDAGSKYVPIVSHLFPSQTAVFAGDTGYTLW